MSCLTPLVRQLCGAALALVISLPALAWNAAGHRLTAMIAWPLMNADTQAFVMRQLERHPDASRWREKAGSQQAAERFAEAATWADDIRADPRYYDETRDTPTLPIPGLSDHARHKRWHYVDFDQQGRSVSGELDHRLPELITQLAREPENAAGDSHLSWALPWLIHLVGDAHQPLHAGRAGDVGGNELEVEFSHRPRQPFGKLHQFWDGLPGANSLRGRRLQQRAAKLIENIPSGATVGRPADWLRESHSLLAQVYPRQNGSLLPLIDAATEDAALALAEQRIALAGYRLAKVLDQIVAERVSRGTLPPGHSDKSHSTFRLESHP